MPKLSTSPPDHTCPVAKAPNANRPSHPRNMHDFDDFDPAAGHLEMRMILAEHLRRISCSFGLNDRIAADVVFRIRSSLCVDLLGLPKRRAAVDHGRLVVAHPFHPRIHTLLLLLGSGFLHHLLKVGPIGHVQDHELFHWLSSHETNKRNISLRHGGFYALSCGPTTTPSASSHCA